MGGLLKLVYLCLILPAPVQFLRERDGDEERNHANASDNHARLPQVHEGDVKDRSTSFPCRVTVTVQVFFCEPISTATLSVHVRACWLTAWITSPVCSPAVLAGEPGVTDVTWRPKINGLLASSWYHPYRPVKPSVA